MNRIFCLGILFFFFNSYVKAQKIQTPDSLQSRIVLIGDAGEFKKNKQPVILGIQSTIPFDEKTTILFLGDNVYNTGLPDESAPNYQLMRAVLDSQIHIADNTKAKVYFMPGNHDWNNGKEGGYESIVRQQQYVDNTGRSNVKFYPEDGCPGPVEISITPDVTVIIMDSQWWVHPYDKPGIESDCPFKTKDEVLTQLDDILSRNSKKLVIITFHHTLKSFGIHGGYFTLKQHIFPLTDAFPKAYIPLPIIGSIYPITRGIFGTSEDLSHPLYAAMIADIERVVKGHQNVIFAAGHEHTLQLIKDSSYYYIVSGAGSKATRVSKNKKLLFGVQKNGFVTIDISKNKNVSTTFYTLDSNIVRPAFTTHLLNFATIPTPQNPKDTAREVEVAFKDSVVISASDKYKKTTGLKKIILGENYRKEWSTPIKLKVFNIRKEKGGFKISSLGGGKQTKSLRLIDKTGKEWTLRSVDKDPEKVIPQQLIGTLAQHIVQDMISASFPYAPLITSALARSTGVIEAVPQFFFVPDDPAFGIYRPMFKNTVCMLESEPSSTGKTKSTAKVINKLLDDHDNHVEQQAYLNARLLDNVIGDWDRHFDQWIWETRDTGKGKLYYPVPRDRDQAFFNSDGLLVGYLSKNQFKYLQGFKSHFYDIRWLNWEARDIDKIFLNRLTDNDWRNTINDFQNKLTDAAIRSAIKKLPPEIYPLDSSVIADKLKSRRNALKNEAMKYYRFLSRNVNILGSNQDEYFKVQNSPEGLQVLVYRKKRSADSAGIIYNRSFNSKITKEINIYGLNGNDKFEIDENASSKIKVRMIGGKGNDTFNIKGNVRNYIYDIVSTDTTAEKNGIINSKRSKIELSTNPLVNEYKPYGYSYNIYRFPQINLGYNPEDKLLLGFGFSAKTFGFRKDPYSTYQKLSALYAPDHKAYQIKYQGIFNSAFLKKDILLNVDLVNPALNNFFGYGNETIKDLSKPDDFYRVRYNYLKSDILLRKRMGNDILSVSFGPSYYHYWNKYNDNKNTILANPALIGADSANIYGNKDYLGGKLKIDIDYVNDEIFPSRGITWYTELSSMAGLNNVSKGITKLTTDMTVYASLSEERKFMTILRVGGGYIFNKNYEYFQMLTLGNNNFIRGFRKDRFSGTSSLYASIEPRLKLFKSQSYILPGDVGIIGFYDIGRVWLKNEKSTKWHQTFGGGFYFSPFNIIVLSATVGISDEDNLFNFSLGTKFHLTF